MLALTMMLSLASQGVLAGELTPPAVHEEETGSGASAAVESVGTGAETGISSSQENGPGSSGGENAQPESDASKNSTGENAQPESDASKNSTGGNTQPGTDTSENAPENIQAGDDASEKSAQDNVQPGTDASMNGGENAESVTGSVTDEASSEAGGSSASSEGSHPAVALEATADDGTSIHIDAPEGAFPEGIHVTVKAVEPDQILDALRTASDDPELAAEDVAAYDFDFWIDDGTHQIEPEKEITVQIGLPEFESGDTVSAWHLDSESDETAESETVTAESASGMATITSDVFSIHAIVIRRQAAGGVTIDYDGDSTIHSVAGPDNSKIILFCMNNGLHWPHTMSGIQNVPKYTETTIQEFCKENNIPDPDGNTLARKLKNLLYAGYANNGYALYHVVDQETALTESEFNQLLDPPVYLRTDFSDSIGNDTFTYADRTNSVKMNHLKQFLQAVAELRPNGSTASGLTYSDLTALSFWKAAFCMVNYDAPMDAYSNLYVSGTYVIQGQAYDSTSRAIWTFLQNSGVPNNTPVVQDTLTAKLLDAVDYDNVLDQPVSTDIFSVWGDKTFQYSPEDGKWHTGSLMLFGYNYMAPFMLSLPDGVSEESGKTQISVMERFSLVASSPEAITNISLSAKVPWMDGPLRVYKPMGNATASDSKGFQNMVGAVIRTTDVSVPVSITRIDENTDLTFTKRWEDVDNKDGLCPTAADYASKLHLMKGSTEVMDATPAVTDNGDNTWTVTYSNLPKYANGAAIAYSVKEDSINGYTADVETVKDGEMLTNTHKVTSSTTPSSETIPETNGKKTSQGAGTAANSSNTANSGSAKTGDSSALGLYGALAALSMALLLVLFGMAHRRNKI